MTSTPSPFTAFYRKDVARWGKVVRQSGATANQMRQNREKVIHSAIRSVAVKQRARRATLLKGEIEFAEIL